MNTTKESTQEETEVSSEQEIETKERKLLSPKAGMTLRGQKRSSSMSRGPSRRKDGLQKANKRVC